MILGGRAGSLLLLAALTGCAPPPGTIGAVLARSADGTLWIREVPAELGAARVGLEPGDQILLIDGLDVRAFDAAGVHELLSGELGAPVQLTVLRGEEVIRVTLERTPIPKRKRDRRGDRGSGSSRPTPRGDYTPETP